VPEADDVNITRADIERNFAAFNFRSTADIDFYEKLLREGFNVISDALQNIDQIFVDTKFEFGYVTDRNGDEKLIYMDEVGTPDSSRIWDGPSYREGKVIEKSKEEFRQALLSYFPDPDILLNKDRMPERAALARDNALPESILMQVSQTYLDIAAKIIGSPIALSDTPKQAILDILSSQYGLIVQESALSAVPLHQGRLLEPGVAGLQLHHPADNDERRRLDLCRGDKRRHALQRAGQHFLVLCRALLHQSHGHVRWRTMSNQLRADALQS